MAYSSNEQSVTQGDVLGVDRYLVTRVLGQGGAGKVYLARDRETGEALAVKKLFRVDGKSALRIKREFRGLADLSHPNLIKVYELARGRDGWCLAMEYVPGVDLWSYLFPGTSAFPNAMPSPGGTSGTEIRPRILRAFHDLAVGVEALHRAGMLHRDLKPSNVIVERETERVVVLDFGLARELDPAALTLSDEGDSCGSPKYMAPEQVRGQPLSEAADWYAFGVMLYEALTGVLPAWGDLHALLRRKLEQAPLPPQDLNDGIPRELSDLCMALLSLEPSERPTGTQVLDTLGANSDTVPRSAIRKTRRSSVLAEGPSRTFVGRDVELARLFMAVPSAETGQTVVAHVCGTSGVGKSTLVEHFLSQLEETLPAKEVLVLRGRCYEREMMPFKALDGVIDALSRHLARLDPVCAAHVLPSEIGALAQLFPVLTRLEAVRQLSPGCKVGGDDSRNRRRAEVALRELFSRLAARTPLVIWIDDLQWGDLDSTSILCGWLEHAPNLPVLLVLSYRSDEVETSECLKQLVGGAQAPFKAKQLRIAVAEMPAADVQELCQRRLSKRVGEQDAVIEYIIRESQGSPFLAAQLSSLVNAKLERGDTDLHSITIGDLLKQTADLLPVNGIELLSVLAVAGRPVRTPVALKVAGVVTGHRKIVHALQALQLVRGRHTGGERLLEVYHDRVRASVHGQLSEGEVQRIQAALLDQIGAEGAADPDWLYTLAVGAGDKKAAYHYGVLAAERAAEKLAFERAAEHYRQCFKLGLPLTGRELGDLWCRLGDVLGWCGRGAEAADAYLQAAGFAEAQTDALRLMRLATSHLLRSGRFEQGEALLLRTLGKMALTVPRSQAALKVAIVWERLRVRCSGWLLGAKGAASAEALARIDAYQELGEETSLIHQVRGAFFLARSFRWALKAGEPMRLLRALCGAFYAASVDGSERAKRRTDKLMTQARELTDALGAPEARVVFFAHQTLAFVMLGRFQEVLAPSEHAERLYLKLAHGHLEAHYFMRLAVVASRIGALFEVHEFARFESELQATLEEARSKDNHAAVLLLSRCETLLESCTGRALDGVRRLEEQRGQLPRGQFGVYHLLHMFSVASTACAAGRIDWGMKLLREDWPRYQRSAIRGAPQLAFLAHWGRARLLVSQHCAERPSARPSREIEAALATLEGRKRLDRGIGVAHALRARMAFAAKERTLAIGHLKSALRDDPGSSNVPVYNYALGAIVTGAEGDRQRNSSATYLRERGVVDPEGLVRGHFPEFF